MPSPLPTPSLGGLLGAVEDFDVLEPHVDVLPAMDLKRKRPLGAARIVRKLGRAVESQTTLSSQAPN